jgi:hypothetical protein
MDDFALKILFTNHVRDEGVSISVVEHLLRIHKALGSLPSTTNKHMCQRH